MDKIKLIIIGLLGIGMGLAIGLYLGRKPVTLKSNNKLFPSVGLKGSFNQELGELISVKGKVLGESNSKADQGKVRMSVFEVDGKKLKYPVEITLQTYSWSGIQLPKEGEKVSYIGYESGAMTGIPRKAFDYLPMVATTDFFFEKFFILCKKL